MLCVVIQGPTLTDAKEQISKANLSADLIEFRLDLLEIFDIQEIKKLREATPLPVLFTYRTKEQGGACSLTYEEREKRIIDFASLKPDYFDLEYNTPPTLISQFKAQHPNIKLILSYHDFENTPTDLSQLQTKIPQIPGTHVKIATWCHNSLDAFRLMEYGQDKKDVMVMGMGEYGTVTRVLAPVMGSKITYASLENKQAIVPGQVPISLLAETYHHALLSPSTAIFGLIGHPVEKSISQMTHNTLFQQCRIDGVYIKIPLQINEIPPFLTMAKALKMKGISVTMPLKEAIIPHLDEIDPMAAEIGAVNTLIFNKDKVKGYNVDGIGGIDAIEEQFLVKDKVMVVLGTGGAAKALIYEGKKRGAQVIVLSRDEKKGQEVAYRFGCLGGGFSKLQELTEKDYHVIVNCTPEPMPIDPKWLKAGTYAMDLTIQPKETPFLKQAREKGALPIYGYQMFVNQATEQFKLWLGESFSPSMIKLILQRSADSVLAHTEE